MIAKMVKGRGFRGALEYDLTKEKGRVIDSNMAGQNPRELAAEFGEIRKLRPNLGKAVLHVSLSAAPGEHLTDEQWREIAQRYLRGMGFTDNQFVITRHADTDHEHIHILANRITHGGEVVSDGQDYKRQETIMREIERDFRLQRVAPSIEADRRAPTKGEIEGSIRTGQPSTRQQLQRLCDAACKGCSSFSEYQERLEAVGVELIPVVQQGGARLSGLMYRLDGVMMKGSDLGRGYSPAGLAKRGVTYEQDRDFSAIRHCRERDAARAFGEPDRGSEAGQASERGGPGGDAGAPGPGDGGADRRDAADAGRDRPPEQGAGRAVQDRNRHHGAILSGGGAEGAEGYRSPGPGRAQVGARAFPPGGAAEHGYGGSRERILELAGTVAEGAGHVGRAGSVRSPETRLDRIREAVQRQIEALGVARLEIGIREPSSGPMTSREWSVAATLKQVAWLRRMNARGNDIFVRPAATESHAIILLDELHNEMLPELREAEFDPAVIIETDPGCYQAWVKLAPHGVSPEVRQEAAQSLAMRFGAVSGGAHSYGRLAGFMNCRSGTDRDRHYPEVLIHACRGVTAPAGIALIKRAQIDLEQQSRMEMILAGDSPVGAAQVTQAYCREAHGLLTRYGEDADLSLIDWEVGRQLAEAGWKPEQIAVAIIEASPSMGSWNEWRLEGYAQRIAEEVWQDPGVVARREQRSAMARDQDHDGLR